MIYADNAATTKLDMDAFEAMKPFLLDEYGNASQPYIFSRKSKIALKEMRKIVAECIGAKPEEIFFTSGGTESDNWAIRGIMMENNGMLTSEIEHHAVLETCNYLKKKGKDIKYISTLPEGMIDLSSAKERLLTSKPNFISVMMVNNEIGSIQPIKELAEMGHNAGAVVHTDAVQAVGHVEINVEELGIDLLSASAHKFNGPKGIGFLYVRKGTNLAPYLTGGNQEKGMRAGTENVAAIVGMAVALKKNCDQMKQNQSKILELEKIFFRGLKNQNIAYLQNGGSCRVPGNISLSFKDYSGEMLLHRLDLMGICVSTGSACDSINTQVSHVIKAIKVPNDYAKGTIRISLGINNTVEDVETIVKALGKICRNCCDKVK